MKHIAIIIIILSILIVGCAPVFAGTYWNYSWTTSNNQWTWTNYSSNVAANDNTLAPLIQYSLYTMNGYVYFGDVNSFRRLTFVLDTVGNYPGFFTIEYSSNSSGQYKTLTYSFESTIKFSQSSGTLFFSTPGDWVKSSTFNISTNSNTPPDVTLRYWIRIRSVAGTSSTYNNTTVAWVDQIQFGTDTPTVVVPGIDLRGDTLSIGTVAGVDSTQNLKVNEGGSFSGKTSGIPWYMVNTVGVTFNDDYVPSSGTASLATTALNAISSGTSSLATAAIKLQTLTTATATTALYANVAGTATTANYAPSAGTSSFSTTAMSAIFASTASVASIVISNLVYAETSTAASGVFDWDMASNFAMSTTTASDNILFNATVSGGDISKGTTYFISSTLFTRIYFEIDTAFNASAAPVFPNIAVSTTDGFIPITLAYDSTNKFSQNGFIGLFTSITSWWKTNTIGGVEGYILRITYGDKEEILTAPSFDAVSTYWLYPTETNSNITVDYANNAGHLEGFVADEYYRKLNKETLPFVARIVNQNGSSVDYFDLYEAFGDITTNQTMIINSGTYSDSSGSFNINFPNISIIGNGADNTKIQNLSISTSSTNIYNLTTYGVIIINGDCDDSRFYNCAFGDYSYGQPVDPFVITDSGDTILRRLYIENSKFYGREEINAFISFDTITFVNCLFDFSEPSGGIFGNIYIPTGHGQWDFKNCVFKNVDAGNFRFNDMDPGYIVELNFESCTFDNVSSHGLVIGGSNDSNITLRFTNNKFLNVSTVTAGHGDFNVVINDGIFYRATDGFYGNLIATDFVTAPTGSLATTNVSNLLDIGDSGRLTHGQQSSYMQTINPAIASVAVSGSKVASRYALFNGTNGGQITVDIPIPSKMYGQTLSITSIYCSAQRTDSGETTLYQLQETVAAGSGTSDKEIIGTMTVVTTTATGAATDIICTNTITPTIGRSYSLLVTQYWSGGQNQNLISNITICGKLE